MSPLVGLIAGTKSSFPVSRRERYSYDFENERYKHACNTEISSLPRSRIEFPHVEKYLCALNLLKMKK